ncbi:MAG: protein translocase subunit SecF, partial [Candidatus Nanoarchaeia archaeon]|nr:protein translocase subunit SecF [Candidatus Nanoarchaeia archaeon]
GTSFTISNDVADIASLNLDVFKEELQNKFASIEIDVRELKEFTSRKAISIDIDITDKDEINLFKDGLVELIPGLTLEEIEGNMRTTGSSLGDSFFNQIIKAIILAFVFMGIVVFFQFRVIIPSIAVILAAFSDIIVTLAIVNVMGMKLSTAGIAAFLMLIGYSVDTDILLSTRVLKGKVGTVYDRVISSMKTGMLMNVTTLVAVTIALFVSQSDVITQIMTILFIGLLVDIINTWIQNAGILRYYMEKRGAK